MMLFAVAVGLALAPQAALPAGSPEWKDWAPYLGEWVADPGKDGATGAFSLVPELQGRVLVRHNFAEYPKSATRPATRHDDLMVVYHAGGATRADYWDSEGHVIHYAVTIAGERLTFVSDVQPAQPRFRLSYVVTKPGALALTFEVAPPGKPDAFAPYIQASVHRK